jgi:hypothetical protein
MRLTISCTYKIVIKRKEEQSGKTVDWSFMLCILNVTGKSLSEALIFASANPQYDDRLFIELQVQYMKIPSSEHGENMLCTEFFFDIQNNFCTQHVLLTFRTISVHNMFSPCSAKRRASDKDLPVCNIQGSENFHYRKILCFWYLV